MRLSLSVLILSFLMTISALAVERPSKEHDVYFKGTDYELNVYRIYGRQDGKTMLIVGGIQGDEPGGFLSADLYSGLRLEKGNLIVIPRANFKSIILYDRGPDGDMNRRFKGEHPKDDMDKVVGIIMELMKESDVFLNLHDGWGYHYPTYVDKWRNPFRFGQSIITDANIFKCSDGTELDLRGIANTVLDKVNNRIEDKKYHLHYFNTNTEDPNTRFGDMRKTATYYALQTYCLPSFGVESSKNLPTLEMKVLHHNYAVNEFMHYYGIVPEHPSIFLLKPQLYYTVVNVNGVPKIIDEGETLIIEKGDLVEVTHIEANYQRGVSCDVLGTGELNDYRKKIQVNDDTKIVFRKDNDKMGLIDLKLKRTKNGKYLVFIVKVNGEKRSFLADETIDVSKRDRLEFVAAVSDSSCGHDYPVNFKGYVPPVSTNTGDDRGYEIPMNSNFMDKYSRDGDGKTFPVIVKSGGVELGTVWVRIKDR